MNREALTCPKCGSPDLEKVSWSERRCRHCGVLSVLSPSQQFLLLEWQCPQCGFNNEKGWKRCGKCGTPLVKACPSCRAEMRWDLTHCPQCGQPYGRGEAAGGGREAEGPVVEAGRPVAKARGCGRALRALAGLALSALLVAAAYWFFSSRDRTVKPLLRLDSPSADMSAIAWSPAGDRLAAGTHGGEILMWHMPDGALQRTLGGDPGSVRGLTFSVDRVTLISGSAAGMRHAGQIRLWNTADGIATRIFDLGSETSTERGVRALALSRDGRLLAVGIQAGRSGEVELWSVPGWTRAALWETAPLGGLSISPDASSVAAAMSDGTVELRRTADGQVVRTFAHGKTSAAVAFSPDGSQLATAGGNVVKLWRIQGGTLLHEMGGFSCSATSVTFSPNGALVAAGSACLDGGAVTLWQADTGTMLRQMETAGDGVSAIAFSPDGDLVAGGGGEAVYVWRVP